MASKVDAEIKIGGAKKLIKNFEKVQASSVPKKRKKVLIVYAHYEQDSFNGAVLKTTVDKLKEEGHDVTTSDLYKLKFNPVIGKHDIEDYEDNSTPFNYLHEVSKAHKEGKLSAEIMAEQKKLTSAGLVIFQFPMQWFYMPAILKGWMDKVLIPGFAFSYMDHLYDNGLMKGKKAILSFTTGGPANIYTPSGMNGDINILLWPIQNVLKFCGFNILPPEIMFAPDRVAKETREAYLASWKERLDDIFEEKSVAGFVPIDKFQNFTISDSVGDELTRKKEAPSVGQHLGRPIPTDAMRRTRRM